MLVLLVSDEGSWMKECFAPLIGGSDESDESFRWELLLICILNILIIFFKHTFNHMNNRNNWSELIIFYKNSYKNFFLLGEI